MPTRKTATVLGVAAAVVSGVGSAVQSRINGSLAEELGSGFLAAVVSFGSGLVVLTCVVAAWPRARRAVARVVAAVRPDAGGVGGGDGGVGGGDAEVRGGDAEVRGGGAEVRGGAGEVRSGGDGAPGRAAGGQGGRARQPRLRWWQCVGGAAGGFFVAAQGLTVGSLGVAVFIVAIVAGQSVSSVVVDRLGLAPGGVRPVTLGRALGPALAVVAVLVSVSGSLTTPGAIGLAVLPFLAGAGSAWQQAVNGRVRGVASSGPDGGASVGVAAATLLNFVVGTLVLLVALGVSLLVAGPPAGSWPTNPLLYTGGLIGIVFIATAAAVVHRIGVLLLTLGTIAGQIVGALALDLVVPGATPPDTATWLGAALTLVAVALPAVVTATPTRRR